MGVFQKILAAILTLSFIVFCALFGSLPRLRKTPIGFINRLIWIRIPTLLLSVDRLVTGGRFVQLLKRIGNYLVNENHPLVMIFYVSLVIVAQLAFLPRAVPSLPTSLKLPLPLLVVAPYIFTYLSWTSSASYISEANISHELTLYPYDRVLFRPSLPCRTCNLPKPARSKHCRLCKRCIAKADHHCIWVANCLGRENYRWFFLMLLSLGSMLAYGAYLGFFVLEGRIANHSDVVQSPGSSGAAQRWSTGLTWSAYFNRWAWVFSRDIPLGATALLAGMTAPLAWGLLAYHVYLIWAGMTTNESFKWEDWQEDVRDGYVYRHVETRAAAIQGEGRPEGVKDGLVNGNPSEGVDGRAEGRRTETSGEDAVYDWEIETSWPVKPEQRLVSRANPESMKAELGPGTALGPEPWLIVDSMSEVVNIYDLGFWDNLRDIFYLR